MLVKEYVTQELERLNETQLQQVAEYLAFLRFQTRVHTTSPLMAMSVAALYAEFGEEDRRLAEDGMVEYNANLVVEDMQ